jgi:hypothetical protein
MIQKEKKMITGTDNRCEACQADTSFISNGVAYRLKLNHEGIYSEGLAGSDMQIHPFSSSVKYFCNIRCLKKWAPEDISSVGRIKNEMVLNRVI